MKFKITVENGTESKLYPRALFVYSSYWHSWSRVLRFYQNGGTQVEVDMFPLINDKQVNIRKHRTVRSVNDFYSRYMPNNVIEQMVDRYGQELTDRLLHEDFLPQINWDLYEQHCNGGAEFDRIKKQP